MPFTSEQPKRNKMASRFSSVSEEKIISISEEAVPNNTKNATKFGSTDLIISHLIFPTLYSKAENQNTMPCLQKLSSTV